jgi:hypothetical protein
MQLGHLASRGEPDPTDSRLIIAVISAYFGVQRKLKPQVRNLF